MACNVDTILASAAASGIGCINSRRTLLQVIAQVSCVSCSGPPDAPVMLDPDPLGSDTYNLEWTAVAGATYYLFDLGTPPDFATYIFQNEVTTFTSFPIADDPDEARVCRVRAFNDCGTSDYSNTVSFFTSAAPSAPVAIAAAPSDYSSFTANWEIVTGATGYYLDVATDAGFTSFVAGFNNLDVSNVLLYAVTGLAASTTYYYRVRAYDALQPSANSNVITIVTTISPSSITGLEYWARSDQGTYTDAAKTTPATEGSLVYVWDNMGNTGGTPDFIQATSGSRPVYHVTGYPLTYPRLSFNADLLSATTAAHSQPFTMVVVGRFTGETGANEVYLSNFTGGINILQLPTTVDAPVAFAGTVKQSTTYFERFPGFVIYCVNGASSYMSVNGVDQGATNSGANTLDNLGLHIGAIGSGLVGLIGDMYEVMFFNKNLSVTEKANLNAYLSARYLGNFYLTQDDFETYSAGANLNGLNGGHEWNGAYVSRP